MSENNRMSAETFAELSREVLPHIVAIRECLKKRFGADQGASITINTDGFINFKPYNQEWELTRYSCSGEAVISYEYKEVLELEEQK